MSSETKHEESVAALFSGRLIRTQAVWHAVRTLAELVDAKPNALAGDRDLESLLALVSLAGKEFDGLVDDIQKVA